MEYIYTDASFSIQNYIGGVAVIAPKWCKRNIGEWFSRWNIKTVYDKDYIIFSSACKCNNSSDAEKRALGIAFLVANDMLKIKPKLKIEIISDSLAVLNDIIIKESNDPIIQALSNIRRKKNIIISKVKAHNGHKENNLADKWAKKARRNFIKQKEKINNMRMPFKNTNSNNINYSRTNSRANPFDGSTEMDIRALTERVLNDENNIGYVTPEGKVMPRNMAFSSGKPFCRQVKRHGFMLQNVMQAENILQSASKAFIQTELRQEKLL